MSRYYDRRRDFERDRERFERRGRRYDEYRSSPPRDSMMSQRGSEMGGINDMGGTGTGSEGIVNDGNGYGGSNNESMGGGGVGPGGGGPGGAGGGGAGKRMHRIFGTEEDKINCSFYFKIGACRHGERCSRLHMKPNFSQTLLLAHFYMPPPDATAASEEEKKRKEMIGINAYNNKPMPHGVKTDDFSNGIDEDDEMDDAKRKEKEKRQRELEVHYEDFYEDVINEMIKYGDVEELVVCENSGDHMYGNTYVKFSTEEQAAQALVNLRGRYYCGRIIQAEYSPVTDFREGRCRQFDEHNCSRGPYCNFLHLRPVPRFARRYLRRTRLKARYQYGNSEGRRRRRHKMRFNGLAGLIGGSFNESSEDSSLSDDSDYHRRWRTFPIRGNSQERRDCIAQWNQMLSERKERKRKKKELKMAKKQLKENEKRGKSNNNEKDKERERERERGRDNKDRDRDRERDRDRDRHRDRDRDKDRNREKESELKHENDEIMGKEGKGNENENDINYENENEIDNGNGNENESDNDMNMNLNVKSGNDNNSNRSNSNNNKSENDDIDSVLNKLPPNPPQRDDTSQPYMNPERMAMLQRE